MRLNNIKVTIVSLKKKLYPLCSVLVGSRNRFKLDFVNRMASITIDLKQIIIDQTKNFRFFFEMEQIQARFCKQNGIYYN